MRHNYYEDYKLQYKDDVSKRVQPQLSELALQGLAYCTAVLAVSAATNHNNYTAGEKLPGIGWQGCTAAINSARASLIRHEFPQAIAASNPITTHDISHILDNLRPDFEDIFFSNDFQLEVYQTAEEELKNGVQVALFKVFPALSKSPDLKSATLATDVVAKALIAAVLRGAAKNGVVITARNPLYLITHAMHAADFAARQPFIALGRVSSGPIERDSKFTAETAFSFILDKNETNKYPALRRLQRAGICYVANFDIYLTYLTDLCRILEQMLPAEAQSEVSELAQKYLSSRVAIYKISERF